jgi:hypothetical protein
MRSRHFSRKNRVNKSKAENMNEIIEEIKSDAGLKTRSGAARNTTTHTSPGNGAVSFVTR